MKAIEREEQEIATRKRLRLIGEWFAQLNDRVQKHPHAKRQLKRHHSSWLPGWVVDEINQQNFDGADTMAIRNCPGKWCFDPYRWLWILHRYQNHYWKP